MRTLHFARLVGVFAALAITTPLLPSAAADTREHDIFRFYFERAALDNPDTAAAVLKRLEREARAHCRAGAGPSVIEHQSVRTCSVRLFNRAVEAMHPTANIARS